MGNHSERKKKMKLNLIQEYEEKDNEVSIVIPVFNEKEGLQKILPDLCEVAKKYNSKIVIVDDGSTQNCLEVLKNYPDITILRHEKNKGYGASIKTAVSHIKSPWVLMMDSDGQHNPLDIPEFLKFKGMYDMIVGKRIQQNQETLVNAFGRMVLSLVSSYACGHFVKDFNSGMRLFRRDSFMKFFKLYPDGFSISTTMTVTFFIKGFKVHYIPIKILPRASGTSKVSYLKDGVSTLLLIMKILLNLSPVRLFFLPSIGFIVAGLICILYSKIISSITTVGTLFIIIGFLTLVGSALAQIKKSGMKDFEF